MIIYFILFQSFGQVLFFLFYLFILFSEAIHLAAPGNKMTGIHVSLMISLYFILILDVSYNNSFLSFYLSFYFLPGRFRSTIIIYFIAAPAPWILFYLFYLFYSFSCGGLGAGNAIIIYISFPERNHHFRTLVRGGGGLPGLHFRGELRESISSE